MSEERHFGRAAARLHIMPSSLSEQVSRLEKPPSVRRRDGSRYRQR